MAFESIDGPPPEVFRKLVANLNDEAQSWTLDRSGEYLQTADLQMVRSDLERVIREHPIESLLVGVGVGYLVARATRR